jgi:uncharacterized protein YegP (UPF0339 family)
MLMDARLKLLPKEILTSAKPIHYSGRDSLILKCLLSGSDECMKRGGGTMATFELKKSDTGEFHFNFLDEHDKTILRSEQYSSKAAAQNGIESIRTNAGNDARYDLKESQSGKLYFNLKAANGQVIGTSMMYADHAAREAAVLHVKGGAAHAGVVEDL